MKTYHSSKSSPRFIITVIIITVLLAAAAFFLGYFAAKRYNTVFSDAYNRTANNVSSKIDSIQYEILDEVSNNV